MSESMNGASAQQTQTNTQQSLTDAQLRAVLDEYGYARTTDVQTISQKLDTLSSDVASNGQKVDSVAASLASSSSTVVVIDDSQWSEMRDGWLFCKQGVQVGLFLVLALTLVVCAIFGSRLWDTFSKGWRR